MSTLSSPSGNSQIICQSCRKRVPLQFLDSHACTSPGRAQGLRERLEDVAANQSRRKPAAIDTSASWKTGRQAFQTHGLSPSESFKSLSPSPHSLSPSYSASSVSKSTSQSSELSMSSSITSADSSLPSPTSMTGLMSASAKLPFFDKYHKVYGDPSTPSPIATSFSSRSLNSYDRSPPQIALTREYSGSGSSGLSTRSKGSADGKVHPPRSAGLPSRSPAMPRLAGLRSQSDDSMSKRHPAARPSMREAERPSMDNENIGRAFLEDSPYIPDRPSFDSGLKYRPVDNRPRKTSSPPAKILAADALDSLLEDLSVETRGTNSRGSLEDYYFGLQTNDDETSTTITPRASAATAEAPIHAYAPSRARPPPAPMRTVPTASHVPHARAPPQQVTCRHCEKRIDLKDSIEREGGRSCASCYAQRYLPKCRKCRLPIEGRAISSGDGKVKGKFHVDCFNCFACSAPFPNQDFYVFDERPYCAHDYHRLAGSLCKNCGSGIEGHCVTLDADLGGRRFHPGCFTCSHSSCAVQLADYHFVVDGMPFCERHAERRAANQGRRAEKRRTLVASHRAHYSRR